MLPLRPLAQNEATPGAIISISPCADLTGLPPTALHYGEYGTLAGEGADFGRRLADFKIISEVLPLPEGQHSFILGAERVPEVDRAIGQVRAPPAPRQLTWEPPGHADRPPKGNREDHPKELT
ncbi:hypothetical protein AB0C70_27100 [Streptomyces sp. NPDC048564]|uniref:alpha/beta hydrolase n=1 Tax=Streptomyces sp. NPDC048564 TaxID=3155760 RepID=UPI00344A819F